MLESNLVMKVDEGRRVAGEEMSICRRQRERIRIKNVLGYNYKLVGLLLVCWLACVNEVMAYTTNNSRDEDEDGRPVRVGLSPIILNISPAPENLDKEALSELKNIAQDMAEHYVQLAFPKADGSGKSYCEYLFLRAIKPLYNPNRSRHLAEEKSILLFIQGGFASFRIPSDGSLSPPSTQKLDSLVNDALVTNLLPALQTESENFQQVTSIAIGGIPVLPPDDDKPKITSQPSAMPSTAPSSLPTTVPSSSPSLNPTTAPSQTPSSYPSTEPSLAPSAVPSTQSSTFTSERGVGSLGVGNGNNGDPQQTVDLAAQSLRGNGDSPSSSSSTPVIAGVAATAAITLFLLSALFVFKQRQKQKRELQEEDPSAVLKSHQTLSSSSGSLVMSASSPAPTSSSDDLKPNASSEGSLNSVLSHTSSTTASSSSSSVSDGSKSKSSAANLRSLSSLVENGCLQLRLDDGGVDGDNKIDSLCNIGVSLPSASSSATFDTQANDNGAAADKQLERARQEAATRAQNVAVAASVVAARRKLMQEQYQSNHLQEQSPSARSSSDLSMGAYTTDSSMADESSAGWTTSSEATTPSHNNQHLRSSTSSSADASSIETDPSIGYGWKYSPSGHMVRSGYGSGNSNHRNETGAHSNASDADSYVSATSSGQSSVAYLSDFDDAGVGGGGMYAASSSYYHHRAVTQPVTTSVIAQLNASANNSSNNSPNNVESNRNATYAIRKDMMSTMNSFDDYHGVYHLPNSPSVPHPPSQYHHPQRTQQQRQPASPQNAQPNATNQPPPPPPPPPSSFFRRPQQRNSVLQPSHFTASSTQATSTQRPSTPQSISRASSSSDAFEPDSSWDPNDNEAGSDIVRGSDSFTTAAAALASINKTSPSSSSS